MFKCLMVVGVVVALAGQADAIHRASVELTAGTFESSIAGKTVRSHEQPREYSTIPHVCLASNPGKENSLRLLCRLVGTRVFV